MFANFKLRNRILLGYSVPIVLLVVMSGLAYSSANKVAASIRQTNNSQTGIIESDNAVLGLSKSERSMRGYLLSGDDGSRQNFEKGLKEFRERVEATSKVTENPEQKARVQQMIELGNRLDKFNHKVVSLFQAGKASEAVKLYSTQQGRKLIRDVEALNEEFNQKEIAILAATTNSAQTASNFLMLVSGVGTLLALTIALTAAYLISFSITRILTQAASALTSSSTEIAATIEQQERTITQQASSVNQTTTTMDELGASSRQSAEQAEASAAGTRQALTLAEEGTLAVQHTLDEMSSLKESVGALAQQILRLSEQTAQIGSVSDLVGDLANQTNMLALNAAVEAARAGDHGKGFGVVAAEIRKLADQSKKSAEKINTLVADIQAAINSTVMVTDVGTKKVDLGMQLAQGTAETFTGVADSLNNVFLNSQQIALSAKQQAFAVQQVVDAMTAINNGAKESASGITQVKASTQQLKEAAQELKAVV